MDDFLIGSQSDEYAWWDYYMDDSDEEISLSNDYGAIVELD